VQGCSSTSSRRSPSRGAPPSSREFLVALRPRQPWLNARGAYARAATWLSSALHHGQEGRRAAFLARARVKRRVRREARWPPGAMSERRGDASPAIAGRLLRSACCAAPMAEMHSGSWAISAASPSSAASMRRRSMTSAMEGRWQAPGGLNWRAAERCDRARLPEADSPASPARRRRAKGQAEQFANDVRGGTLSLVGTAHGALAEIKRRGRPPRRKKRDARHAGGAGIHLLVGPLRAEDADLDRAPARPKRSIGNYVQHKERLGARRYGELHPAGARRGRATGQGQVDAARATLARTIRA
jgi:hypothetical protein